MNTKYVFNKHIAPITANARDDKKKVLWSKKFLPVQKDSTTGRTISTGYTALTGEEYETLMKTSKIFKGYVEDLKLLKVQDDIPPDAKTPHEALVGERKKSAELANKVTSLENEIAKLSAELEDYKTKYGQLVSAGGKGKKSSEETN